MKHFRKRLAILVSLALLFSSFTCNGMLVTAKKSKKIALNKKSVKLYKGKTVKLYLKNTKKKPKWSSSKKSVAKVSKKGVVTALKSGKATITAKLGKKKYKCAITVKTKKKTTATKKPVSTNVPAVTNSAQPDESLLPATEAPLNTPEHATQTTNPTQTQSPSQTQSPTQTVKPKPTSTSGTQTASPEPTSTSGTQTASPKPTSTSGTQTASPKPTSTSGTQTASPEPTSTSGTQTASPEPTSTSGTQTASPKPTSTSGTQTASPKPTSTSPTQPASPTPTATSSANNPGQDVTIPSGRNVFEMGEKKVSLDLTYSQVLTVLGQVSGDSIREATSPQGYKSLSYINEDNSEYLLFYFKNDKVVSIFGIGEDWSYANGVVSVGMTESNLTSGWTADNEWFVTKNGSHPCAYDKDFSNEHVIAYTDYYYNKTVYAIQIYSGELDRKEMVEKADAANYTKAVVSELALQMTEMLAVYRYSLFGCPREARFDTVMSKVSQEYADQLANSNSTEATKRSSATIGEKMKPLFWPEMKSAFEGAYEGNSDAIGFLNSLIADENASIYLQNYPYYAWGCAASSWSGSDAYVFMVIDACNAQYDAVILEE